MARLGRGQPVPPVIRRSSLVDVPPPTDYPLRTTYVVPQDRRAVAARLAAATQPEISHGLMDGSTPPSTDYALRPVFVTPLDRSRITAMRAVVRPFYAHGLMNGTAPFNFPATALGIIVEIAPGADPADDPDVWPWVDVTAYVLIRDQATAITITRGIQREGSQAPVARCSFQLNNRDGRFSTRNPLGAYWPDLILGTPVRVSVVVGAVTSVRFTGRMDDLPPRWDISENDRWVPVTASGIMRRLGVGVAPLGPPTTAATAAATDLLASWPCTDRAGVSGAAEASGGPSLSSNGKVTWATITGPDGATMLPDLTDGGVLAGPVPTTATVTQWTQELSVLVDQAATSTIYPAGWDTGGTISTVLVEIKNDATTNVLVIDPSGVSQPVSTSLDLRDGAWHTISLRAAQDGADVDWTLVVDGASAGTGTSTTQTLGRVTQLTIGDGQVGSGLRSVGLVRAWTASTPSVDVTDSVAGYAGETTGTRFARLCVAQGVPYTAHGTGSDLMGAQSADVDFLGQLREIEAVDGGVLADTREGRIGLYCRSSRENATVALALDHDAGHIAPPFEPDDSATSAVNDLTARMSATSAAGVERRVQNAAHIAKYQRYAGSPLSLNAAYPSQLTAAAGLRVWLGVWEGYRYPVLSLDLARNPTLATTAATLDINDRIQVSNPPDPLSDTIDVILLGSSEELGTYRWRMRWATTPYGPWDVGVAVATPANGDGGGWAIPDSLVLAEDLDLTETAVDVTSVPVLPTSAAHYPIDIEIDAEVMTVASCSGAGPTQTLTVTRGTGGVTTTHLTSRPISILDALILTM